MRTKKKYVELSVQELLTKLIENPIPKLKTPKDSDIDYSDIPEITPAEFKKAKFLSQTPLGKALKVAVQIHLDPGVLLKLKSKAKKMGVKYQTLIDNIIRKAV